MASKQFGLFLSNTAIIDENLMFSLSFKLRRGHAEGVEAKEQFEILLDFGCDQIQGFYLGKPLPPDTFQSTFLSNGFIEFPSTSISATGLSL